MNSVEIAAAEGSAHTADDEHPVWCSPEHCVTHDYGTWTAVAHSSAPVVVKLFEHLIEVELWESVRRGEPEPDEGFIVEPMGPVVSLRRMAPSGPTADDAHFVLPLYGARVLSKGLASLLAQYDRATPLTR